MTQIPNSSTFMFRQTTSSSLNFWKFFRNLVSSKINQPHRRNKLSLFLNEHSTTKHCSSNDSNFLHVDKNLVHLLMLNFLNFYSVKGDQSHRTSKLSCYVFEGSDSNIKISCRQATLFRLKKLCSLWKPNDKIFQKSSQEDFKIRHSTDYNFAQDKKNMIHHVINFVCIFWDFQNFPKLWPLLISLSTNISNSAFKWTHIPITHNKLSHFKEVWYNLF